VYQLHPGRDSGNACTVSRVNYNFVRWFWTKMDAVPANHFL
jgi:hypothetical protein